VDPRAGMDDVEKRKFLTIPGLELRLLGHPARSQSQMKIINFVEIVFSYPFPLYYCSSVLLLRIILHQPVFFNSSNYFRRQIS
jgi:hypothetical protein